MTTWFALVLLVLSNVFMTFAWFGHLKNHGDDMLVKVILVSWGIAFFEYILMIPAVRMASKTLTVSQIKIIQEALSLTIFIPFSVYFLKENFKWDYVAAMGCILLAVFFIFREKMFG